jgi:hypothetical protein
MYSIRHNRRTQRKLGGFMKEEYMRLGEYIREKRLDDPQGAQPHRKAQDADDSFRNLWSIEKSRLHKTGEKRFCYRRRTLLIQRTFFSRLQWLERMCFLTFDYATWRNLRKGGFQMAEKQKNRKSGRASRRHKPPLVKKPPQYEVEMSCPICNHRAFDLSCFSNDELWVGMKCPNCNNIIHVPCVAEPPPAYNVGAPK